MASIPPMILIGTAVVCLGNLIHIIGLGTPHWEELEAGRITEYRGLFKICNDQDVCATLDNPGSKLAAVQAMIIIGMLLGLLSGAAALLYVLMTLLSKTPPKLLTLVCTGASCAAFAFIIIGIIIYGAAIFADQNEYFSLGYSFGLCIAGAILMAIGGVLVFMGSKSTS